jgi:flagellar hook assembly protein FlgD
LDLLQAYPNPFNAAATISFNLSTPQTVDVVIYNILGQRVRMLWSGVKEAGEHFLEWDGRDGSGQVLASGVYLYRVTTETKQIAKSIVLVK